uniref:Uncharacterized protein n=1 Tax=Rhizophora mucronata TaxID=61149 RepID=A0A2P2MPV2_RHIMU
MNLTSPTYIIMVTALPVTIRYTNKWIGTKHECFSSTPSRLLAAFC